MERNTKVISFRVESDLAQQLSLMATREGCNVAELVRQIVVTSLNRTEAKNEDIAVQSANSECIRALARDFAAVAAAILISCAGLNEFEARKWIEEKLSAWRD